MSNKELKLIRSHSFWYTDWQLTLILFVKLLGIFSCPKLNDSWKHQLFQKRVNKFISGKRDQGIHPTIAKKNLLLTLGTLGSIHLFTYMIISL